VNFYKHHLGDYDGDTNHLSWDEDMAYTRLLRAYYRREKPLPLDPGEVFRLVRASTKTQKEAVTRCITEFFSEQPDGWHNKRADEEIEAYRKQCQVNKEVGKLGGRPRKTESVISGNRTETEVVSRKNPNQIPEPEEARSERASRLSSSWEPSLSLKAWFSENRPDLDLTATVANFRDHWKAASGSNARKHDWDAAFRTWARNERASLRPVQAAGKVAL
jgi:uncharacterized protein YdaU (DUF1376 family)